MKILNAIVFGSVLFTPICSYSATWSDFFGDWVNQQHFNEICNSSNNQIEDMVLSIKPSSMTENVISCEIQSIARKSENSFFVSRKCQTDNQEDQTEDYVILTTDHNQLTVEYSPLLVNGASVGFPSSQYKRCPLVP